MLRRQFHSSVTRSFKQKAGSGGRKTGVPNKSGGAEFRNFRRAAAHTKLHYETAPQVTTLELLNTEFKPGMYSFPDIVGKSLTYAGSFSSQKNKELFNTRTTLIRQQTVDLVKNLDKSRKLLLGPVGIGKSALLSQIHAAAKAQDWTILHIPHAMSVIDGSTDHIQSGDQYLQPMLVKRWFKSIRRANPDLSSECLEILSAKDAATKLEALFAQLEKEGKKVLLSMDGINAWTHQPYAANRNKSNEPIYHGDLQVPRLFLDYFSGKKQINGAVFATTTGLYDTNATFNAAFGRQEAPAYAPITEYDPVLSDKLNSVEPVDVSYMTLDEARAWISYLNQAGIAPEADDQLVHDRYAVSGGNPSYLLKSFVNYSF